ncbi:MAG: LysR family transcriptional regulator [Betaproteobacteria bacterium]
MRNAPITQHNSAPDAELDAFNAAFDELGLEWHWDRATMAELAPIGDDRERVRAYVQRHRAHLLKVYDADFLGALVADTKRRQSQAIAG